MDESKKRKDNGLDEGGKWMFIEFLGHKKIVGFVTECEMWGQVLMRVDIPTGVNTETGKMIFTTQFYGTHALYCATPILESDAIHLAKQFRPSPFSHFDLHKESNMNLDDYNFEEKDPF